MSWTQVQTIEHTDCDPVRVVRTKKMIWSDESQQFETHYFIRIQCETAQQRQETGTWLQEQFGDPGYQKTWWHDPGNSRWVWLADNLATFWQLKYGGLA